MTSFLEERFPLEISRGAEALSSWATEIVELDSGREVRNSPRSAPRLSWDVAPAVRRAELVADLRRFWNALSGPLVGFRFRDPVDHSSTRPGWTPVATDQEIGTGDGAETAFQLVKRYAVGGETYTRTITKPVEHSVRVALDNVEQSSGWSVDTTTGIVTFDTAPAAGVTIQAGFEFDVPVRFEERELALTARLDHLHEAGSIRLIELIQ